MSLPGFPADELERPPGKAELRQREREYRALAVWFKTNDEGEVRKALRCRNNHEARILVNRGAKRYDVERVENLALIRARQHMDLERLRQGHIDAAGSGDVPSSHVILKLQERESRLAGSDAEKEAAVQVGTFILSGGASAKDIAAIPEGATVIDARLPWERENDEGAP